MVRCLHRAGRHGVNVKTILALIIALAPAVASGQLLKCVGKDGRVVYASNCPADTTEQRLRTGGTGGTSSGAAPAAKAPQSLADRDADFKKRMVEQQEAQQKDAKKQAEDQVRRDDCTAAQAYLKSLEEGQRIARTDPKTGERVFLDDSERAAEMTRARTRVSQSCR